MKTNSQLYNTEEIYNTYKKNIKVKTQNLEMLPAPKPGVLR